ncbi:MAG: acyl-CoA dehydrogenase, partial [Acidimicrobiaceae bacterium]|nr:acyl-CoA dehydrogenase [Acidimicrobiaceae bacterium]
MAEHSAPGESLPARLKSALSSVPVGPGAPEGLRLLTRTTVLDQIPLPGTGRTLERWQLLAMVAEYDCSLGRLVEGHTDALAILSELGGPMPVPGAVLGVWAAGQPGEVSATPDGDGNLWLKGRRRWCSGAGTLTHALVTATLPD